MDSTKKIAFVPDEMCKECSQYYEGECRAFMMPHTKEERRSRERDKSILFCRTYSDHVTPDLPGELADLP